MSNLLTMVVKEMRCGARGRRLRSESEETIELDGLITVAAALPLPAYSTREVIGKIERQIEGRTTG
jgi:hypothetical protein